MLRTQQGTGYLRYYIVAEAGCYATILRKLVPRAPIDASGARRAAGSGRLCTIRA